MIFPEPRKDRLHQQGIAFISTLVFAVLGFFFLTISELEIQKTSREVFRRIDMTSLMPQGLRLGRIEVSESNSNNVQLITQTAKEDNEPAGEDEASDGNTSAVLEPPEINPNVEEGQVEAASGGEGQPIEQTQPSAQRPEMESRPPQSTGGMSSGNTSAHSPQNPENIAAASGGGIPRLPLDSFGRDYKSLNVREIINWMKSNPSELPKGIRQLVRFRPAFLSSVETFTMDGKEYELYLMCKESLFEVHVVLVEQNEATYLVDRSFQKLSTYLRKGQVRRTQDNQIIAVRSNMATNDSSDEFYSLFLSWWDWTKQQQPELE